MQQDGFHEPYRQHLIAEFDEGKQLLVNIMPMQL